ncbi:uncharacterized protein LOC111206170 [Brassica napus]|uniref:uncharacterized protein LOC111206170 n=1 Tax=Brassica napus TaxID=3708 RepID=UPI00207A2CB7|nr:uncharacterized protein LOC111206170 [Brassica napus]
MKDSASLLLDSSSMSVDSAPISVESSYLSLSSMTPRLSRSPRRLTSMKNHSTSLSILWPSSTKSNRKVKMDGSRDMKVLQRRGLWSGRIKRQWLFQAREYMRLHMKILSLGSGRITV